MATKKVRKGIQFIFSFPCFVGSGMKKIRIRDKHSGCATLLIKTKNSYRLYRKVHCEEQVLPGAVQVDRQLNLPRLLA
jgi:hypothetical protein